MSKNLVDTNILLRLILRDDAEGLQMAEALLESAEANECVVTALTVAEVLYVLHVLGYDRENCAASAMALMTFEQFSVDGNSIRALKLYQEYKLDFVDCYLIAMAISDGIELKTLDKKARRLYERLQVQV